MKRLIYLLAWLLSNAGVLFAQDWSPKETGLTISVGNHFFAPKQMENLYGSIQYNRLFSYRADAKSPKISFLLNPTLTFGGRYKDSSSELLLVKPLQSGVVSLLPTLFVSSLIDNDSKRDIEVFALVRAGLNYYPLLEGTNTTSRWTNINGYEQWQLGFGAGIRFKDFLKIDGIFYRAGYDFSTNTRTYFEANINKSAFFRAIQVSS